MTKIDHINNSSNGALRDSLSAIKHAQIQLRHLTHTCASPTVLASQIELCEVLLAEISGVHSSLAKDIDQARGLPKANGHAGLNC
jgi:hypothetical protein